METKKKEMDFGRWAITGVIAPIIVILVLRFAIAPFFWPDLAAELGARLGGLFILYLICLACAAVVWKIKNDKKAESGVSKQRDEDSQHPPAN